MSTNTNTFGYCIDNIKFISEEIKENQKLTDSHISGLSKLFHENLIRLFLICQDTQTNFKHVYTWANSFLDEDIKVAVANEDGNIYSNVKRFREQTKMMEINSIIRL